MESGTTVTDNIYLLSLEEVSNPEYGFHPSIDYESNTRKAEGTDLSVFNNVWWLRTHYSLSLQEMAGRYFVEPEGSITATTVQNDTLYGVRPALYINLADFTQWTYAGTVDADGNTKEPVQLSVDSPVHGRGFYAETMGFHEADWVVAAENWQKRKTETGWMWDLKKWQKQKVFIVCGRR